MRSHRSHRLGRLLKRFTRSRSLSLPLLLALTWLAPCLFPEPTGWSHKVNAQAASRAAGIFAPDGLLKLFQVELVNAHGNDLPVATANTITVNSTADTSGNVSICTLRDAITAANTNTATGGCPAGSPGMDTINFNLGHICAVSPCTITLSGNLPLITEDLTIDGLGFFPTISGNALINVLAINGAGTVNVSNLRIKNGNASNGGGINNLLGATLTVTNVTFSGNNSNDGNGITDGGGAIKQWNGGTLNIVNSSFLGNSAAKVGGAIQAIGGANVTVSGSTFSNNSTTLTGGAILQDSGTLGVSNSTFTNNTAGYGGAISATSGVTLAMANVTFNSNNVCSPNCVNGANGGAIYQAGGPLAVANSTFNANIANLGGGIYQGGGGTSIDGTSFSSNQASIGGAIESVGALLIATSRLLKN